MKKKRVIIIVVSVVVLLLLLVVFKGGGGKDGILKVAVAEVERTDITEMVDASGRIQPETELKISADVSGEIIELQVKEGDQVTQGQLLCKINPDLVEAALNRAEASLNSSRASLANARARLAQTEAQFIATESTYKRTKKLRDSGAISTAEFESAESSYLMGKADVEAAKQSVNASGYNVKSAEATVKEAKDNLGRTSIFSPMNGTVSALFKEEGERVVGNSMMEGSVIMHIADLEVMEANVEVNENLIPRVALGDTAYIEVDAFLGRKFKGIVTEISQSPTTSGMNVDQVTNYPVTIQLLRDSYEDLINEATPYLSPFRPGMSTAVEIRTNFVSNTIAVPVEAVTARNDTASKNRFEKLDQALGTTEVPEELEDFDCVFVVVDGQVQIRKVEAGIQDNDHREIISGLKEGEKVVVSPYNAVSQQLSNRDRVRVVDKNQVFK